MKKSPPLAGAGNRDRLVRHIVRYSAAIAAVALSLAVRHALSLILGPDLPVFLLFSPAVLVVASLAGMGPGLASTGAAVLGTALWIYPSTEYLAAPSANHAVSLLLFCVTGFLMSAFAAFYKRALQRAASARQESAASEGEARFSTMFHWSPISMSLMRMSDGKCHDVNKAHVELFGFSRDESLGRSGQELEMWVTPGDRERFIETLSREHRVTNYEADLRRKQGDVVTTLLSAEVISMGGENLVWMLHNDITERKRAEEKFRLVVESAPMGLIIVNGQGQIVLVNAQSEKQFGYSRSELLGSAIENLLPQRFRQTHVGYRTGYLVDPQPRLMGHGRDLFGLRKDGSEFPVEVGLTPLEMPDGTQVMASVIDITERKRTEEALRESDSSLRTLVDAIPGMVLLIDTKGRVINANETMANRLGTTARGLIGTNAFAQLPPEVARVRREYADTCVRTGEPSHYEDSRLGADFDNYMYPIKDGKGEVIRLAVLAVDITDRKKAENKLKEQAALLDIASDAILVKDLDSRILYWNMGAERLYGWSAGEVAGRKTFDLLYAADRVSAGEEALREAIEKGEWRGELDQKTKEGKKVIVEAHWTVIRDDKGAPKGILSVKSDITAKRLIEKQLLRSQRLESLGTLAGGIAHDLNNVLAPILMGIESLSFRNPDDHVRNILSIVKASAQRGANIVRQILNFARGMEGEIGEIQLKHVIHEVEGMIQETFPKSIALKADISKGLWPANGDPTQLHQVLMNLCVNARDAMPEGGWITISAENVSLDETYAKMNIEARPIKYVVLKVEDTGKGMLPSVLEKIFDPFFTTKAPGKGTGLGLSTVHSIVKNHGGFVTVYSEPDRGTAFKVYIPAADQEAQPKEAGPEEGIPLGEGESILVVDDEVALRDITRQVLESNGYRVLTAADGTEAVAKFLEMKKEIRLVITDMMMPHMDGAATIRAIRRISPETRFIATSGLMAGDHAKEAKGLGVRAFLVKPYTAEKLLYTLREVLDQKAGESGS